MTALARGTLVVRDAERRDLARIAEIECASFSDPWSLESLETAMALSHVRFFAAQEGGAGGRVVGYVVALVMGDEGEIADLAVDPGMRRSGVGARLLARVVEEMARRGVQALYLEVRSSNVAALGLYRAQGFEAVGRRRGYYRHPVEDALVLRREIVPT